MTKPSIERIIRDSRAECLVLSRGEAKVMVDEIVRLRAVLKLAGDDLSLIVAKTAIGKDRTVIRMAKYLRAERR